MSLDDIVENVLEEADVLFFVKPSEERRPAYISMLKSELRKKRAKKYTPEKKNDPFFRYLLDRTVMLSYLMQELRLYKDTRYEPIKTDEELRSLHVHYSDGFWSDRELGKLYKRRYNGHKHHNLPNYIGIIDELGKLKVIKEIWGRRIIYDRDIAVKQAPKIRKPRRRKQLERRTRFPSTHRR